MQLTSTLAHERHEANGNAAKHRDVVKNLVANNPGSTAVELYMSQQHLSDDRYLTRHEISRRLPELRADGLVRNGDRRKCRIKCNLQMTWLPVEKESE